MKMIPGYCDDIHERKVFKLLEQFNLCDNSIAIHTEKFHGGKNQRSSEIDFLVFTKRAIIGIEVKNGPVSYNHAEGWTIGSYKKQKSPYRQIHDALDVWRTNWFKDTFGSIFSSIPFIPIAILCKNNRHDWEHNSPSLLPDEYVYYRHDLTPDRLKLKFNETINYFIREDCISKNPSELSTEEIDQITKSIRPHVDCSLASSSAMTVMHEKQDEFTEVQYSLLDKLETFDRLIIDGGAGTGKTFVMNHLALLSKKKNQETVIISRHLHLLKDIEEKTNNEIICMDFNFKSKIKIDNHKNKYDIIFIDEGQDLCNPEDMLLIDEMLKGGLEEGEWRWFGDFQNQFSDKKLFDKESYDSLLKFTGNKALYPLTKNVRNTPTTVEFLEKYCKARVGETEMGGFGPDVDPLDDEERFKELLLGDDIVNKYGYSDKSNFTLLYQSEEDMKKLNISNELNKQKIKTFSIEEFRGLEAKVIFITGLQEINDLEELKNSLYKSVSRNRGICYINSTKSLLIKFQSLKEFN